MSSCPAVSFAEARQLTDKIKRGLDTVAADIKKAHKVRAWRVLDYPNWDAYCRAEFGHCMLRVPAEKRVEMVRSLEMFGMTYAEIGSAMGTSAATAWRDSKKAADAVSNETPPKPKPKPIPKPDALNTRGNRGFGKIAEGSLEIQAVIKSGKFGVHQAAFIKETRDTYNFAVEQLLKLGQLYEDINPVPLDEDGAA